MWTLILLCSINRGAGVSHVSGFTTQASCEQVGISVKKDLPSMFDYCKFTCQQVK